MKTLLCRASVLLSCALGLAVDFESSVQAGLPVSGLLYYTRYQSPAEVKKVQFTYDGGTNFSFANSVSITTLPGSDGLTVAPDGTLIVGSCGNGQISRVDPTTGAYVSVPAGGGACHLSLDPSRLKAWAGFTYSGNSALSEIPLFPQFTNGIPHTISGDESGVGTLEWDANGNVYYTSSNPAGDGSFGLIDLTTFHTKRLLANVPAAHGMAYDPFSGTFILFGSTHITQVNATPTSATIIGDLVFPVQEFDQGTVDGLGHIFAADNGGNMAFIDYSSNNNITNSANFYALKYLDSYLDDVAPIGLVGSGGIADLTVTYTATPNPVNSRSNVVITFTITNAGPAGATNVVFRDTLPSNAGLEKITSSVGQCTSGDGQATCQIPFLLPNTSASVTLVMRAISGNISNRAIVTADQTDPSFSGNIEIAVIASPDACLPPPSGLVGWWPGDGNALDYADTNNGTMANPAQFGPGKVGQAFVFDGVTDLVNMGDQPAYHLTNFTFECWAAFNRLDGVHTLVSKALGNGDDDSYTVWLQDGTLHAYSSFAGLSSPQLSFGFTSIPGTWHHIAYTVDTVGSNQVLYVDGQAVASSTVTGVIQYDAHPFLIGSDISYNNFSYRMTGSIDEPSMYNRALSAAEIAAIYYASTEGKCSTPVIVPASVGPAPAAAPFALQFTLAHASPAFTFRQESPLPGGFSFSPSGLLSNPTPPPEVSTVTISGVDAYGQGATGVYQLSFTVPQTLPPGLLGWWRGESNALDELGVHNGTLVGGTGFAPGYDGTAFQLNGNGAYIDIGPWLPLSRWSVEAWANPSVIQSGRHNIFGSLNNCRDWGIGIQDGQFVAFGRPPGGCTFSMPSGVYAQVGRWYHLVETVDGTNAILYVNGVPVNTNAVDLNFIGEPTDLRIGSSPCCGEYFAGLIDEARIYDRAIAPDAIVNLYSAGPAGGKPVGPAPVITVPPTNTTATVFGQAELCVHASLDAGLSYQWFLGSLPIPGANAACLPFNPVTTNAAGAYMVSVANANGVSYSPVANLTVIDMKFYAAVPIYGQVGATYRIDYTTPDNPTSWTTLATIQLPSNPYIYIDYGSPGQNSRLYRVIRLQ